MEMFLTIKLCTNWIVFNRTDYLHKMDLALNNHKTQQTNLMHIVLNCFEKELFYI